MTNPSVVAFVIFVLASGGGGGGWRLAQAATGQCRQLDPCRCEFENGQGIDLRQVETIGDNYMETWDPKTQDRFFFHPCKNIQYLPTDGGECKSGVGYSLCRFNNTTKAYTKLGTTADSHFRSDDNGQQFLVFKLNSIETSIQLLCLQDDQSYFYVKQDGAKLNAGNDSILYYNMVLFSPHACPITIEEISKPSTGGVLLILFLIGTFTYFTIGSIVRFMYLGARGIEVIPNLDFWKDLPGLVRDGIRFLQNGCRVERREPDPDSYDAI